MRAKERCARVERGVGAIVWIVLGIGLLVRGKVVRRGIAILEDIRAVAIVVIVILYVVIVLSVMIHRKRGTNQSSGDSMTFRRRAMAELNARE